MSEKDLRTEEQAPLRLNNAGEGASAPLKRGLDTGGGLTLSEAWLPETRKRCTNSTSGKMKLLSKQGSKPQISLIFCLVSIKI